MDIEVIREYIRRDPRLLESIKKVMDYRQLRTEQAFYAKLAYQYDQLYKAGRFGGNFKICKMVRDAGEFDRSYWKDRLIELDKQRRNKHNAALAGFAGIVNTGRLYGFPKIYSGKVLDSKQIEEHGNPDIREQMTDAMFDMLATIENEIIRDNKEVSQEQESLKDLAKQIKINDREFHVKPGKGIIHDEDYKEDGGIEFELSTIFDKMF